MIILKQTHRPYSLLENVRGFLNAEAKIRLQVTTNVLVCMKEKYNKVIEYLILCCA